MAFTQESTGIALSTSSQYLYGQQRMADLPNCIPHRLFFTFHNHLMNLVWVAQDRGITVWISTICPKGTYVEGPSGGRVNYM